MSDYYNALAEFERAYFSKKLAENEGKVNQTCRAIGLNKVTFSAKLKQLGIDWRLFKYPGYQPIISPAVEAIGAAPVHVVPTAMRAEYAVYAKNAQFSDYSEYAEFSKRAKQAECTI